MDLIIVKWMIETGRKATNSGNWVFYLDEIADEFNLSFQKAEKLSDAIIDGLRKAEEVAECSYDNQIFDVTFYTSFCCYCN